MKSLKSPKAFSRPVLRITVPTVENTTPWRTMALVLQSPRSSTFSWRRLFRKNKTSRDGETYPTEDPASPSSETLVESPTEEKPSSPKVVRFDDTPTYFRTRHRIKPHKSSTPKGALRSCLVINNTDPFKELLSDDDDDVSVYEDCLTSYPGFFKDMEDLFEREYLKQMEIEKSRSSWELTEFGCTKIDPQEYLSSCLAKQAERKLREDIEGRRKVVYDHPMTLRWPSREITERPVKKPPIISMTPPPRFVPNPTPVILSWHQQIASDIFDMLISLCIGLTIQMCICILGIYCFFSDIFSDEE